MSSTKNLELKQTAFLSKSNSKFIEEMYMKFVNQDPSLPESWKNYFAEIGDEAEVIVNEINGPSWRPSKKFSINKNFKNDKFLKKNFISPYIKTKKKIFVFFNITSFFYYFRRHKPRFNFPFS